MKISMQMIADRLASYNPETHIRDMEPSLVNVKFINQEKSALRQEFVYVARAEEVREEHFGNGPINLICIGHYSFIQDRLSRAASNIMILNPGCDPFVVFNEIQDFFDFCNQWENELQEAVIKGQGLQALVDLSYKVFNNPMFILDSAFMALAWSRDCGPTPNNEIWQSIKSQGHANTELIKYTKDKGVLSSLDAFREPTISSFPEFPYRAITQSIRINSNIFVRIAIEEFNTAFTESHLHFAALLGKYIWSVICRDLHYQKTQGTLYEHFIIEQLEGKKHDPEIIRHYLQYQGWKTSDRYSLLIVKGSEKDYKNNTLNYYGNLLQGMFQGSKVFLYENNIVLLVNEDNLRMSKNSFYSLLKEFLEKNNLQGAASLTFNNFYDLYEHYLQASSALSLGSSLRNDQVLHFYKDYAVYHFIQNLAKDNMNLYLFCHPAVRFLNEYDKQYHTDYFNSLYIYLLKNKSIADSAKALGIHRNTFTYRIEKIMSLTDLDLTCENEFPYLLLSFKIIEFHNKIHTPK